MKEKEKTTDPKEIIMNDRELMASIEEIVNRSVKEGYNKTDVLNVISNTWNESKSRCRSTIKLTDELKTFLEGQSNKTLPPNLLLKYTTIIGVFILKKMDIFGII